jgi:hypothetical protein
MPDFDRDDDLESDGDVIQSCEALARRRTVVAIRSVIAVGTTLALWPRPSQAGGLERAYAREATVHTAS